MHLRIKKPDLDRPRPLTPEAAVASKSLRHLRCVYCCWKINARFVSSILQFFILLMNICNILTVCMKHILLVSRSCPHIMRNPSSCQQFRRTTRVGQQKARAVPGLVSPIFRDLTSCIKHSPCRTNTHVYIQRKKGQHKTEKSHYKFSGP